MAKSGISCMAEEPSIAPLPERWYNLELGSSFGDRDPSSKFCTLRYEFKPASVDKSQSGLLHRKKDNTVAVEFPNNQFGKPRVRFEGVSEDYKEHDAVVVFNSLVGLLEWPWCDPELSIVLLHCGWRAVDVEKIEINDPISEALEVKSEEEDEPGEAPVHPTNLDSEEHVSIVDSDSLDEKKPAPLFKREIHISFDINFPLQNEEENEIADVDVRDNELVYPGWNAADALWALVVVERDEQSSSSRSRSESGSDNSSRGGSKSQSESGNGSRRGSSSTDSESSEGDSVCSI